MQLLFAIAWLTGILLALYGIGYFDSRQEVHLEVLLFLLVIWWQLGRQIQRAIFVLDQYLTQRLNKLERRIDKNITPEEQAYDDDEIMRTIMEGVQRSKWRMK